MILICVHHLLIHICIKTVSNRYKNVLQGLSQEEMGQSKHTSKSSSVQPPTLRQQAEALRQNLTRDDLEKICTEFSISRATYFRKIRLMNPTDQITHAIIKLAAANKQKAEQLKQDFQESIQKLV
ncbi:hypothetical protein [Hymenobacter pini]|uniref:hypothetical protein n=1 Tax=Hymenobacter pini TaxID=2880879 RepID=UPI001CF37332|nr:hypothetical protein [Hymenobacter pini]MCA8831945.1 hypothetical protein [Hymenobacter pini]